MLAMNWQDRFDGPYPFFKVKKPERDGYSFVDDGADCYDYSDLFCNPLAREIILVIKGTDWCRNASDGAVKRKESSWSNTGASVSAIRLVPDIRKSKQGIFC